MRRSLVVALLLAFVLQAQLAASHFHIASPGAAMALGDDGGKKAPPDQKKVPAEDDCPICQQLASAHSFLFHASAALALLEIGADRAVVVRVDSRAVPIIALNWQSRAPPL